MSFLKSSMPPALFLLAQPQIGEVHDACVKRPLAPEWPVLDIGFPESTGLGKDGVAPAGISNLILLGLVGRQSGLEMASRVDTKRSKLVNPIPAH